MKKQIQIIIFLILILDGIVILLIKLDLSGTCIGQFCQKLFMFVRQTYGNPNFPRLLTKKTGCDTMKATLCHFPAIEKLVFGYPNHVRLYARTNVNCGAQKRSHWNIKKIINTMFNS